MYVKSISFENYRNLRNIKYFPSKGINVICGDNAQGKTNFIEGLWLFTGGRSFRGAKDSELMTFGCRKARAQLCFRSQERDQSLIIDISSGKRTAVLNDVTRSYMSQIIGCFCAVVFSPDHLTLIKSGPEERRNFIDAAICQLRPSYASVLSRYKRIMNERNALLKDIPRHRELEDTLDIWNERLANEGSLAAAERFRYVEKLRVLAERFYDGISDGKEELSISYKTGYGGEKDMSREELKEKMLAALEKRQSDDIYCGFTTSGIHRDDLTVMINGREARSFGSQGQQRSAVLSLKLAEASVLKNEKGEAPVILLDDVLSELDPSRQSYLLNKLEGLQVFITCCDADITGGNRIYIRDGEIISEGTDSVSSSGE